MTTTKSFTKEIEWFDISYLKPELENPVIFYDIDNQFGSSNYGIHPDNFFEIKYWAYLPEFPGVES